jgi:hypothetical protein
MFNNMESRIWSHEFSSPSTSILLGLPLWLLHIFSSARLLSGISLNSRSPPSLTSFNMSSSSHSLAANWTACFHVHNPGGVQLLYTTISIRKSKILCKAQIRPFKQSYTNTDDTSIWNVAFASKNAHIDRLVA